MSTKSALKIDLIENVMVRPALGALQRFRANAERRKALREIRCFSHRTLKDIGIDRSESLSVIYGPTEERRRVYVESAL